MTIPPAKCPNDNTVIPLSRIAVIDLEASSLGSASFPTEIGRALLHDDGTVTSGGCLIRPGIKRQMLDRDSVSPREAAHKMQPPRSDRLPTTTNALLALMIGFAFGAGLNQFEERRQAVLDEANSVATGAFYARLQAAPHNAEILKLLTDYVQIRLEIAENPRGANRAATVSRSNAIQDALWREVLRSQRGGDAKSATPLLQSLNQKANDQRKRLMATLTQIPEIVIISLYGIAAVSSVISGFANGSQSLPARAVVAAMGLVVCSLMLLIQDLDRPGIGFLAVDQQPLVDVRDRLSSYLQQLNETIQ